MVVIQTLIIINYLIALIALHYIATDKHWFKIVQEYKDKDKRTYEIMQQNWFRHVMCIVMLIPGYCLYLVLSNILKNFFK